MAHQSTTIATSSQDISEKTTMELNTTEDIVAYLREWSMDKLEEADSIGAKDASYKEFEEWIEVEDKDDIDLLVLEPLEDVIQELDED